MGRIRVGGAEIDCVDTPVPCSRLSSDGTLLSCGNADHQGVLGLRGRSYKQLVPLSKARNLKPNRLVFKDGACQLRNTRFSPDGEKLLIVQGTQGTFPRRVEIFVYDLGDGSFRWLSGDLQHPT